MFFHTLLLLLRFRFSHCCSTYGVEFCRLFSCLTVPSEEHFRNPHIVTVVYCTTDIVHSNLPFCGLDFLYGRVRYLHPLRAVEVSWQCRVPHAARGAALLFVEAEKASRHLLGSALLPTVPDGGKMQAP